MARFPLVLACVALLWACVGAQEFRAPSDFERHLRAWAESDEVTPEFRGALDSLRFPTELQRSDWRSFSAGRDAAACLVCRSTLSVFLGLRRSGMSQESIRRKVTKLCTLLNIQKENVCRGAIDMNLPIIIHIVDSRPNLSASTICGVLLESRHCPLTDPEHHWSLPLDEGPKIHRRPQEAGGELRILQLTDIHYDPSYQVNGNARCEEPTCCRVGQNSTNQRGALAGFWGDYNDCDTPWHAVEDALDHAREAHVKLDYVYFTGDIIDHGVWETSQAGNEESIRRSYDKLRSTFGDVPVYPILGNHEPHPLNLFAPRSVTQQNLSTNWLYELSADLWISNGWLPESTRATILQGGFYTLTPRKGFRIIALNSNVCYCYNWWLWYSPKDPDGQLAWFASTLKTAEANGEAVHVLSHIPAGNKHCAGAWKAQYLRTVERYSHVLAAQFNGHTHNDELQVFYDSVATPVAVAWNGGSVTAYSRLNPNYKVYGVDAASLEVKNYENWTYNLTLANETPDRRPRWYMSYSFKEEYGLKDLSAKSLSEWLVDAAANEALLDKYYRNFFKHAEASLSRPCNAACKRDYLCRVVASADQPALCASLLAQRR